MFIGQISTTSGALARTSSVILGSGGVFHSCSLSQASPSGLRRNRSKRGLSVQPR